MWRVFKVDRDTWADSDPVSGFVSAHVERSLDGSLIDSGSLVLDTDVSESFDEGYYRISMAEAGGRTDIATLLCRKGDGTRDRGRCRLDVTGLSVLEPARAMKLSSGEYAPAGCDGAEFAAALLRRCVHAPIRVAGSFGLDSNVVFDIGSTVLDAAWLVLDAGNHIMQIAGDGSVSIVARGSGDPVPLDEDSVAPGIPHHRETGKVKNRYKAVDGPLTAIAVNDYPASPTSVPSVGYYDDEVDESPTRVNGETLQAYAERRLSELSVIEERFEYTRTWVDGILPGTTVVARLPRAGVEGELVVRSQSIECGALVKVRETATREERTWPV